MTADREALAKRAEQLNAAFLAEDGRTSKAGSERLWEPFAPRERGSMIEDRRVKAGHLAHREMGCTVKVTTTEGVEIRDVLVGAVYGAPADRRISNANGAPDGPNLLLAFAKTGPFNPQSFENRYFEVAADSVAIIYREDES